MLISQIIECSLARWSPGIGDPGPVGWLTVIAYLAAAGFSVSLAAKHERGALERAFWTISGVGLLFLAVNKQLDLQSFLTATGRCAAQLQDWYEMRRTVQIAFITVLIAASVIGGVSALWALRGTIRRTGVSIVGLVWITGFVLVRAAGFHHIDEVIGFQMMGLRLNWVFELGGIAVFLLGCAIASSAPTRARSQY